jgi:hypothetical protein
VTLMHSISALCGGIALCGVTLFGFHLGPQGQDTKKPDVPTYSGTIGEWWVAAPGRVQFQLVGAGRDIKDGKTPDLWFDTPADKDLNTLFENLVLDTVAYAHQKGVPVTVEAKHSSGDDGTTAAKAFDVIRVGVGKL